MPVVCACAVANAMHSPITNNRAALIIFHTSTKTDRRRSNVNVSVRTRIDCLPAVAKRPQRFTLSTYSAAHGAIDIVRFDYIEQSLMLIKRKLKNACGDGDGGHPMTWRRA